MILFYMLKKYDQTPQYNASASVDFDNQQWNSFKLKRQVLLESSVFKSVKGC